MFPEAGCQGPEHARRLLLVGEQHHLWLPHRAAKSAIDGAAADPGHDVWEGCYSKGMEVLGCPVACKTPWPPADDTKCQPCSACVVCVATRNSNGPDNPCQTSSLQQNVGVQQQLKKRGCQLADSAAATVAGAAAATTCCSSQVAVTLRAAGVWLSCGAQLFQGSSAICV